MDNTTIGLDIDGVIVDYATSMLPLLSEVCNRPVSPEDIYTYDLAECLELDDKAVEYIWQKTLGTDFLRNAPPVDGAIEGLSELGDHEIWIITGRPSSLKDLTESWLAARGIKYDRIIFDRVMDKMTVGPEFDFFVEDFLEGALTIAGAGIFTILFDQPWNQTPSLPANCRRVHDWPTIVGIISGTGQ
jgi:uncharacterized HAD superfamily protein